MQPKMNMGDQERDERRWRDWCRVGIAGRKYGGR